MPHRSLLRNELFQRIALLITLFELPSFRYLFIRSEHRSSSAPCGLPGTLSGYFWRCPRPLFPDIREVILGHFFLSPPPLPTSSPYPRHLFLPLLFNSLSVPTIQSHGHRFCGQVHWCWCCHRWCRWIRCRYWLRLRLSHHRLRQESIPQATALLIRHSGFRPFRGHGALLSDDGVLVAVRFLEDCQRQLRFSSQSSITSIRSIYYYSFHTRGRARIVTELCAFRLLCFARTTVI